MRLGPQNEELLAVNSARLKLVCASATLAMFMNSQRIRERWHRDTRPFVFRLSDGTRVPVAHPDFMMMPPGFGLIIVFGRKGGETRIDALRVVAIEEVPPRRAEANGKRRR